MDPRDAPSAPAPEAQQAAIAAARAAVAAAPADAGAWVRLGQALLAAGRRPAALDAFSTALDGAPANREALAGCAAAEPPVAGAPGRVIGAFLDRLAASGAAEDAWAAAIGTLRAAGRTVVAAAAAERAAAAWPQATGLRLLLGELRLAANRAVEAEADFRAVTEAAPELLGGWTGLLDCLSRQRRHAEGRAAAAAAVARHPEAADLAARHAGFLLAAKDVAAAEREARRCVTLAPAQEGAWLTLADAVWRQHRMRDATLALEQGLAALPDSAALAARLGHLLIAQDKRLPAIAAYRRAVAAGPVPAHVWLGLTDALWRLHRIREATEAARSGVAAHPGHAELRARLAQLLLAAGAEEEAGNTLAEAIASRPESEEVRLAMADALWRQGRRAEAVAAAREAAAAAPDRPAVAARLGHLLIEAGEIAEAAALFERITAEAPGLVAGWVGLCDVERERKNIKAAIAACRRAEEAGADRHTLRMLRFRLYGEIEE